MIVAYDFLVVATASFRTLYVLVIMELGIGRILHQNVTAHPTAEWTLQQLREAFPDEHPYRFVSRVGSQNRIRSAQRRYVTPV